MAKLLSLRDQYTFYGKYDTNRVNVAIHLACVPVIFTTALILANAAFPSLTLGSFEALGLGVNLTPAIVTASLYAAYFILLFPKGGLLYAPILLAEGFFANSIPKTTLVITVAAVAHAISWIAQFIGHGKFEGNRPALLDNILQSVVLAVFFVWLEFLFHLGFEPNLAKELNLNIAKARAGKLK